LPASPKAQQTVSYNWLKLTLDASELEAEVAPEAWASVAAWSGEPSLQTS
jgi:hypothetical protein